MEFRKEDMWTDGRYEYERLPRHRLPPREVPPDGDYHRVVNIVHRRPDDESFHRFEDYSDADFREYEEARGYGTERKSGPSHRGEDPGYRWPRGEPHASRHPEYRENKEGFRRKAFYPPTPYISERSPHRRESPFFRESPDKERPGSHSLKSSKDVSPSSSAAIPPSKGADLDKGSRLSESVLVEAASKWVAEKMEKAAESGAPEAADEYAGLSSALFGDQSADRETNVSGNSEFFEGTSHSSRSKAITAKTKEIEEVYRQDCETFGMVVKMLIDKDPTLEKPVQFALRQNLSEIGERCIEELKIFIAEYDAAHQEFA
ncbi:periphilin-1 isoform X3 [Ascaphus truei]|uniref:periphilin-1 isoform X3 n=1 Tax=Ascaphus truei TaxID=8439 RepID=UPI003F5A3B6C